MKEVVAFLPKPICKAGGAVLEGAVLVALDVGLGGAAEAGCGAEGVGACAPLAEDAPAELTPP